MNATERKVVDELIAACGTCVHQITLYFQAASVPIRMYGAMHLAIRAIEQAEALIDARGDDAAHGIDVVG